MLEQGWSNLVRDLSRKTIWIFRIALSGNETRVAIGAPFIDKRASVKVEALADRTWYSIGYDIEGISFADSAGESVSLSLDGQTLAVGAPKGRYVRVLALEQDAFR